MSLRYIVYGVGQHTRRVVVQDAHETNLALFQVLNEIYQERFDVRFVNREYDSRRN